MPSCLQEVSIYAHSAIQIFKTVETVQIVNLAHSSQEDYHPSSVVCRLSSLSSVLRLPMSEPWLPA